MHLGTRVAAWVLFFSSVAMAGRPLHTSDADPVEPKHFEFKAAVEYLAEDDCRHFDFPLELNYGLVPRLEVGIGFGGQFEDRDGEDGQTVQEEGLADIALAFKWRILDEKTAIFSQALQGEVKLPVADDDAQLGTGAIDYDLTWVATRQITDQLSVLFNIGYTWVGENDEEDFSDVVHYSAAATFKLTEMLEPVAEVLFETPTQDGRTSSAVNAGLRLHISESLMLDIGASTRLAGDWPWWTATAGMTWAF